MPRSKRLRWIRSKRRFTAHLASSVGTRRVVFNSSISNGVTNENQGYISSALLGWKGGADTPGHQSGFNDVQRIYAGEVSGGALNSGASGCMLITSAVLDTTFHNTGDKQLEVDMYEIYCGGNKPVDQADLATILDDFDLDVPDGVGTSIQLNQRGVTPFECPRLAASGLKIYKKTKYFVQSGEVFTYQMRDPRNHWVSLRQLAETDTAQQGFKGKMTKCLLAVMKQVAGSGSGFSGFTWGTTRTYRYKIVQNYGQTGEYS